MGEPRDTGPEVGPGESGAGDGGPVRREGDASGEWSTSEFPGYDIEYDAAHDGEPEAAPTEPPPAR